jgi:hypothetical protein
MRLLTQGGGVPYQYISHQVCVVVAGPIPFQRPINWKRLRSDEAERIIRERVADTNNVIISEHAFERINERSQCGLLIAEDIYNILENGQVEGQPSLEDGEWKVTVVKRMPGTREAGVVTLFARSDTSLFVLTVEWMDWLR